MSADRDIAQFIDAIGAEEPSPDSQTYAQWKNLFKRSNYFRLNGKLMIVKISRTKPPFWGVGKKFLDFFNAFMDDYYLVLLVSSREGWVFTKSEITARIRKRLWNLGADNDYKINYPLPDSNSFFSPQNFLKKLGFSDEYQSV